MPAFALAAWLSTPFEGKWDFAPARGSILLAGRVLAVTENSITVVPLEEKAQVTVFPFHIRLSMGSYNLLEPDGYAYSRYDAKPGDSVALRILEFNKINHCISFSIYERPGGKVPPCRKYWVGQYQPYHQFCEAARTFNENKVPIPFHLDPLTPGYLFPAFDRNYPKSKRLKPFPEVHPFSYIEYALFLR